ALDLIDASGNPNFLSPEGEAFRWQTESATITADYADGDASYGVPDPTLLQSEVDAYDAVGLFGDAGTHAPTDLAPLIDTAPIDGVYGERSAVVSPACPPARERVADPSGRRAVGVRATGRTRPRRHRRVGHLPTGP